MRTTPAVASVALSVLLGVASAVKLSESSAVNFTHVQGLPGVFQTGFGNCPNLQYAAFSDVIAAPDGKTLIFTPMASSAIGVFEPETRKYARGLPPRTARFPSPPRPLASPLCNFICCARGARCHTDSWQLVPIADDPTGPYVQPPKFFPANRLYPSTASNRGCHFSTGVLAHNGCAPCTTRERARARARAFN